MERETAVVVAVVVVGYSLYGGLAIGAGAAAGALSVAEVSDTNATPTTATGAGEVALDFRGVAGEVGFEYDGVEWSTGVQGGVMTDSGVYAVDYDDDGWTDLLALGGDRPVLFENEGGTFRPSNALPDLDRHVRTALFFDADTDGRQELVLFSLGHAPLYLENRGDEFVVRDAGFEGALAVPMAATAGDYDGDGCPDLFVAQNGDWTDRHPAGEGSYDLEMGEDNGNPNRLYRGDCEGGFENVSDAAGIRGERWSLATTMVDFDGDGRQDIYVANDFNRDVLYLNQGDGEFSYREMGERTNRNGMSAEVGDVNGDGHPDIFVSNIYLPPTVAETAEATSGIRAQGNNLLINRGNGTFVERAEQYNVLRGGWGWAASFVDLDNDMDEDLFQATRHMVFDYVTSTFTRPEVQRLYSDYPEFLRPALFQYDNGTFRQVPSQYVGLDVADGRGVAATDFDRDGTVDIAVSNLSGPYNLYGNAVETAHRSIQLEVRAGEGTTALGARVHVTAGGTTQVGYRTAESDYLSQDSRVLHFGTANNTRADVRVVWPDGTERTFSNLATGHRYVLTPAGIERRVEYA